MDYSSGVQSSSRRIIDTLGMTMMDKFKAKVEKNGLNDAARSSRIAISQFFVSRTIPDYLTALEYPNSKTGMTSANEIRDLVQE